MPWIMPITGSLRGAKQDIYGRLPCVNRMEEQISGRVEGQTKATYKIGWEGDSILVQTMSRLLFRRSDSVISPDRINP